MGSDFKCGCRASGSKWFLCNKHESKLIGELEEYE